MNEYKDRFLELVNNSKTIFISSHVSVDGDNLGSITALLNFLRDMGKDAYVLKSDIIPESYNFLPSIDDIVLYKDLNKNADLYITLDCADLDRLGDNKEIFLNTEKKMVIDHHITNCGYGDLNIVEPDISSTCEILADILFRTDKKISRDVATSLYTGISTDTGRFLYTNVSPETFEIAKKLMILGADTETININLFQSRPMRKLKILQRGIEKMNACLDGKLTYTIITQNDLKETGAFIYDLDEIVNFIRDTEGVLASFIVKEQETNLYKVSLRSKGDLNVSKIAQKFGGGGHVNASGLTYHGEIDDIVKSLVKEIKNAI